MKVKLILIFFISLISASIIFIFVKISFLNIDKNFYSEKIITITLPALYQITKEIVGDKFEVFLILPAGAEIHNFEIGPKELEKIKKSMLIFVVDLGIDDWLINALKDYHLKIINLTTNVNLIRNEKGLDPHFWLSIENMKIVANEISNQVIILDPKNKEFYQKNLSEVLAKLNNLKQESQQRLEKISQRNLIVQHDAFNYFAQENNLKIIGYLEDANGEISMQELQSLIRKIKELNIKQIFKVAGEESNLLNNLAQELNLVVYELDPLEGKKTLNFFEAYLNNLKTLENALK